MFVCWPHSSPGNVSVPCPAYLPWIGEGNVLYDHLKVNWCISIYIQNVRHCGFNYITRLDSGTIQTFSVILLVSNELITE